MNPTGSFSAWLLPAFYMFRTRQTPFHLIGLGAVGRLGLIADYLARPELLSETGESLPGPDGYGDSPYPLLTRTLICESAPPASRAGATGDLYRNLEREPSGPRLIIGTGGMVADFLDAAAPGPDEGILVFTGGPSGRHRPAIQDLLKRKGDLGLWVELGPPETSGGARPLRCHRYVREGAASALLARFDGARLRMTVLPGWNFLQPSEPVRRQRLTVEEPPRGHKTSGA